MNKMIFWILAAYGMSTIIVYGSIFNKPRQWIKTHSNFFGELISCMLCTPTWVGFIFSIFVFSLTEKVFPTKLLLLGIDLTVLRNIFLDGMFTAGSVWAVNSIIEWFERK